jgi:hypothetical protein
MIFMVSLQWHAFCTKSSLLVFPRWLLPVTYISQQITIRYSALCIWPHQNCSMIHIFRQVILIFCVKIQGAKAPSEANEPIISKVDIS